MKKLIAFLLALSCLFVLCACGGETEEKEEKETSLDLSALSQQIIEKIGVSMPQLNENMALNMYGLSSEDCAEMYVYSDYDATKCNELWLIKAADEAALENVKTYAQNRVDSLLQQSNNYNAEVYAASQKAEIEVRGLYLMLCVSTAADSAEAAKLFLEA